VPRARDVILEQRAAVELLAAQESGLAGSTTSTLRSIWRMIDLDVLVVDLHALQAVHVLDLAHQVVGQRLDALQAQDVVRVRLAVGDHLAASPPCSPSNTLSVAPLRNQLLVLLAARW
jgi:hypothetical protein